MKKFKIVITDVETGEQDVIDTNNMVIAFQDPDEPEEDDVLSVGVAVKATNEFLLNIGKNRVVEKACAEGLSSQLPEEIREVIEKLAKHLR